MADKSNDPVALWQNMIGEMQTRTELYDTIGYHLYEALDASIVATVVPQGMPQR